MRVVDLGDLGFTPEEQELLERMEGATTPQPAPRPPQWWITIVGMFVALWFGSMIWHPDERAIPSQPGAALGHTQAEPRVPKPADPADTTQRQAQTYTSQGEAYGRSGDHQRALENFNSAIRLNPNDAVAYFDRGVAYENLGHYPRAVKN